MALSENVNHLVHIVDNDLISIGALNTDDSEAIEPTLPHGVTKPESAERTGIPPFSMLKCSMSTSNKISETTPMNKSDKCE